MSISLVPHPKSAGSAPEPATAIAGTDEIVAELKAGRMVVLVDEEDRENEGDLVLAADFVTPEAINFMARYGRGLICLTLTEERCRHLNLPLMTSVNNTKFGTNFTVSIEAAEGVTTGISAADRARTIQTAVAKNARAADIVQPGHVFPIRAERGGVLMRAGHTEAGCDLAAMAGLTPAAVICEVLNDDGSMARLPDLAGFAQHHGLKIGTIADLIYYRSANESLIERVADRELRTAFGAFRAVAYRDKTGDTAGGAAHLALVRGTISRDREVLVRVHEPTTILDLLETETSAHSWTVARALEAISRAEEGVLVMLNCSGGEGAERLFAGFRALAEIDANGADEGGVSEPIQRKPDLRTYGIGSQILRDLGVGKMRLLAAPRKMPSMAGYGLQIAGYSEARSEGESQ